MSRAVFAGAGLLVLLALLGLLGYGLSRDARLAPAALVGRAAPPFALETLDRDTLRLTELRGSIVVLNFWASWCLPCLGEHPLLVAVDEQLRDQGVRVVGVVYQDSRDNAARWMREQGGDWPNLLDPGSRTAIEYGISGVPETFFIDREGRIAHKQIGPLSPDALATWLGSLLERDVTTEPAAPEQ